MKTKDKKKQIEEALMVKLQMADPEVSRADREYNFCLWWNHFRSRLTELRVAGISYKTIRCGDDNIPGIREVNRMPVLRGEDKNGDLRAHGDALGGHGLHLPHRSTAMNNNGKSRTMVKYLSKDDFKEVDSIVKNHLTARNCVTANQII